MAQASSDQDEYIESLEEAVEEIKMFIEAAKGTRG